MIQNWNWLLHQLILNKQGNQLTGEKGTWESALYQLIHESYQQAIDEEDKAVICVLIALHEAVNGTNDLQKLASMCIRYCGEKRG